MFQFVITMEKRRKMQELNVVLEIQCRLCKILELNIFWAENTIFSVVSYRPVVTTTRSLITTFPRTPVFIISLKPIQLLVYLFISQITKTSE